MRLTSVTSMVIVLLYHATSSEGFGVPFTRCILSEDECYYDAMSSLDTIGAIDTVYLDFDKTITTNSYSEIVRNELCGKGYPKVEMSASDACDGFDATNLEAMVDVVDGNDTHTANLVASLSENVIEFLNALRKEDITVKVVSTSWYPITAAQWQTYLYYVSELLDLGFEFEEILAVDDPGPGKSADKGAKIREDNNGTKEFLNNAMFADDSTGNIKSSIMVCNTLYMAKRKGLDNYDFDYIKAATEKGFFN